MAAEWKIHCTKAVAIGSKKIKMQFSILRENMHGLLYYRGDKLSHCESRTKLHWYCPQNLCTSFKWKV